ncbi:MAG TPA: O-antigen ligase family protein [Candidatus Paceibacterota bacterium]|nr:O-antigen ligase family protein [Candidatus Paceibacterota bacterium]
MHIDTKHSWFLKSTEYLFYLFFALFPFITSNSFLYGGTSIRALAVIFFIGVVGIAFACCLFKKDSSVALVRSPLFLALALYLGSLCVSGLHGLSPYTTFWSVATRMTGIWYFLALGVFMLLLWPIIADEKKQHQLIRTIVFSTALYSVLDLLSPDGLGLLFASVPSDAFTLGNSSFAAMYIFGAFLLSLYYLMQSETKKWWMYVLPLLLVLNPNLLNKQVWYGNFSNGIIGEARATAYVVILSLLALGGLWIISKIKDVRTRTHTSYALFGVSVVLLICGAFSLLSPHGYLRTVYLSSGTAARPLVWEISEKAIGQRPFLGWGADNFERVFEQNYDNRLLQDEYGNEAWFDRAHNVFIDQLVDNGIVGLLLYFGVYLVTSFALLLVMLQSSFKKDRLLAAVVLVYFALHIVELQTAFDTSISYPMLAFMFVSAAVLFQRMRATPERKLILALPLSARYGIGALLLGALSWSLMVGAFPFTSAQIANGKIRQAGSTEKRIPLYTTLFSSKIDEQAFLWRTVTDFERGIAEDPKVLENPTKVAGLTKEMSIYETYYRDYVHKNPLNFRAHLNLADTLIYQMLFGVNKLAEAQTVLDAAIALVPQSPQPYWMKAVAYVYMKKFDLAKEYAKKGLDLNPKIKQSQEVVKYVDTSIKTFPNLDLFFFKQI